MNELARQRDPAPEKGGKRPSLIDDWRTLPSIEGRLEVMPAKLADAVRTAHAHGWRCYRGQGATGGSARIALKDVLENGLAIPKAVLTVMGATVRHHADCGRLPIDNKDALATALSAVPQYAVWMYAKYGCDALSEWIKRRPAAQARQSPWTPERTEAAARRCQEVFGGLPSVPVLETYQQTHNDSALYGLCQQISSEGAIARFAAAYGLERKTKNLADGTWGTSKGKRLIRAQYLAVCREFGRYVTDHELSRRGRIVVSDSCLAKDMSEIPGNTLRSRIKEHLGTSVKQLFLDLCKSGKLQSKWAKQVRTPTSSDGRCFDSYSEVWWWEAAQCALAQLPARHVLKRLEIVHHPLIGTSSRESDFRVGSIYVEVLRHPMSMIMTPTTQDARGYAEKMQARIAAYAAEGLVVVTIEPDELADREKLSKHFELVFSLAANKPVTGLDIPTSAGHAPGHWFNADSRDAAIREIFADSDQAPGRFPSFRLMMAKGFGGLKAYLHLNPRTVDRQTEAVRVHTLCIASGNNKPRIPTRVELQAVCVHHKKTLLDADHQVTRTTVLHTFGRGAYQFLNKAWLASAKGNLLDKAQPDVCGFFTSILSHSAMKARPPHD